MIIVQFTPDELKVLHHVLSDIIGNTYLGFNPDDPDYSATHVFEFSQEDFDFLHKIQNVISQFLE